MPDTNPDEIKVLSDDEVQRVWANNKIGELIISPEIDALCATVRALRKALRDYGEHASHCKSNERYPSPECDCILAQHLGASTNESPQH